MVTLRKTFTPNSIILYTQDSTDLIPVNLHPHGPKPIKVGFRDYADTETIFMFNSPWKSPATKSIDQFRNSDVFIFDRIYPQPKERFLMTYFLIKNLASQGARVTLVVPYMPFLRQDHDSADTDPYKTHEGHTAWLALGALGDVGLKYLITLDGHCFKEEGIYSTNPKHRRFPLDKYGNEVDEFSIIPPNLTVINLTMRNPLKRKVLDVAMRGGYLNPNSNKKGILYISPDEGGSYLADVNLRKKRDGDFSNGKVEITCVDSGDLTAELLLNHQIVCPIDDMVSSGSSIVKSINKIREIAYSHNITVNDNLIIKPLSNVFNGKNSIDLMLGVVHNLGLAGAGAWISSAGISEKRMITTNSIVDGNTTLEFGNAVRIQELLQMFVCNIIHNDYDIDRFHEFITKNL
ncbi:ribose-phosphate pyrophosphokinase-like domain-containing protein [Candidatus Micrarchaeota archaeon]|nr:ribose-phosphate pyrophosphokinase-like domain-containing protein [Candidatus Micrarchaeota archaeon]